ncbi:MAG: dTDP-4-amino-4,6-dideoxygalactose transaminase [Gammaproteobacteria bacterium]|nr:dTDP-4-amino-4,6-dideoxygalactose transaminase [Gammaproteobacteria bacterium]
MSISFNKPYLTGDELEFISDAHTRGQLAGDGWYTHKCQEWMQKISGSSSALLTHSCTAALEMAGLLLNLKEGDEIIMPSYTFVSTANAYVLQGAVPVFVDIREDTLNMDEKLIENAISDKTRAILPVHYAGVACEMNSVLDIASSFGLYVIEDAAQAVKSCYRGQALGGIGDLGAYSFHETKNVISGEGGGLLINNPDFKERAEILREKGTNRSGFKRGLVDKYTWVDKGSSYLPGELVAAFLYDQTQHVQKITERRLEIWNLYHRSFRDLENREVLKRPYVPEYCEHNGHMYYILLRDKDSRDNLLSTLKEKSIQTVFHYIPLHSAPAGLQYSRSVGDLSITDSTSDRILRLPMHMELSDEDASTVVEAITAWAQAS